MKEQDASFTAGDLNIELGLMCTEPFFTQTLVMSRNRNRCSQRRTTVARDRGRPLGLATAMGLRADRARPCQPPMSRASGERRSVHERRSRAQAQRARKLLELVGVGRATLRQLHRVSRAP